MPLPIQIFKTGLPARAGSVWDLKGGNSVYNFYGYSGGANAPVLTVNYSAQRSMTVTMNPPVPSTPGTITGSATVCANTSGITYSIFICCQCHHLQLVGSIWLDDYCRSGYHFHYRYIRQCRDNGNVSVTAGNVCGSVRLKTGR